ncbi:hypothetical protein BPT24_040 [Tenacibaculum phage pT24]|uniref:Uncharacterized protein n=1 Tax=Tenacibaculum phage pT24 TaxID=1880590 RepID=A0A1B4XWH4_9CAUD|nr:hypothetical protein HYP10_gp040 [Tenacibaculum phage pT24]BAV39162.1 hypothetical protein BPT24_040 [Tenacibaculum phage pT24]
MNTAIEINKAQQMISNELKRREELVNDKEFVKKCAEIAKEVGITPKQWNENRGLLVLMFANKVCKIENDIERSKTKEIKFI